MSQQGVIISPGLRLGPINAVMGFESQVPNGYLTTTLNNDSSSADAVNFAVGGSAASMKWTAPYTDTFSYIAYDMGSNQTAVGSASFAVAYQQGIASGEFALFHALGSGFGWGVGFYNNGGNIKIALLGSVSGDLGVSWSGNQTLTAGTFYRVQWRTWRRLNSGLYWFAQLKLYDDAGTTLFDSSGIIEMTAYTIGNNICQYLVFGNQGFLAGAADFIYNVDDVIVVGKGALAPQYCKIPATWPDSAEGTYTDWALGVGASEWGAVDERPPNTDEAGDIGGDYIVRASLTPAVQTYNNTSSGITLTGNEKILAVHDMARVRQQSEDIISQSGSSASIYTTGSTLAWNTHSIAGLNREMIIAIAILNSTATVTAMTVTSTTGTGAQTPTFLGAESNGNWRVEIWYLASPTTGIRKVNVTLSASTDVIGMETVLKGGTSVQGVQVADPFRGFQYGSANGNTGTSASTTTPSLVSTNWDYHWCFSAVVSSDTAITAGQTQDQNVTGANGSLGLSHRTAINPAMAQTMSWSSITEGSNWAIIAVNVMPKKKGATFSTLSIINSVEYYDTITGSFSYQYTKLITEAPLGGWTVANINAAEIGVTTASNQSLDRRCTQILQEVAYGLPILEWRPYGYTSLQAMNRAGTY